MDQDPATRRGTLTRADADLVRIRFARQLGHPVEQVWAALAEPAQQRRWLAGVTIDAVQGGRVEFDFGEEGSGAGEVLLARPHELLEHTWQWPGEAPSTVRWELAPAEPASGLVLRHAPVAADAAVDYAVGWHAFLDALAVHLDGGDPAEFAPDHDRLYQLYGPAPAGG